MKPTVLYLGLRPPLDLRLSNVLHYPVIRIEPRCCSMVRKAYSQLPKVTHLIFTSRTAVTIFFKHLTSMKYSLDNKTFLAIGPSTARVIQEQGSFAVSIAPQHTAEGIVDVLKNSSLDDAVLFWPHSSKARRVIPNHLQERGVCFIECDLYDAVLQQPQPIPDISSIEEIIFTSPSTIDGFLAAFGDLPSDKKLTCIGPITRNKLEDVQTLQNFS